MLYNEKIYYGLLCIISFIDPLYHISPWIKWGLRSHPRHNGRHFSDDIVKWIFLNENVWIPIKISLKFVPHDPINNMPALVQIMAWRRLGDKTLSGPMMVRLPTHICVTRHQWVNLLRASFLRGNININLNSMSLLLIKMTQVVEILPHVRQGPTYA